MFEKKYFLQVKNKYFLHLISDNGKFRFRFSVRFWTEISAETERLNDTETETEIHTETEISAETDTETKSFRSLVCHIKNPGQIWEQQLVCI